MMRFLSSGLFYIIFHAIFLLTAVDVSGRSFTNGPGADLELQTGKYIPRDLILIDEYGIARSPAEYPGKPTILSLNYYECKSICGPMLSNLASSLEKLRLEAGRDYQVWTVSINATETPGVALQKKTSIFAGMRRSIPESSWTFFTGKADEIERLADSTGYRFSPQGDGFVHPGVLVILAPDGKIVRYIYGNKYLALDLEMALIEASQGKIGQTIRKALLTCFRYDPEAKTYVLDVTRIGGGTILGFAVIFVLGLSYKSRKKK